MRRSLAFALSGFVALTSLDALAENRAAHDVATSAHERERLLKEATVTIVPGVCAGVIVGDGRHALTAAHCLRDGNARITFELHDGTRIEGDVVLLEKEHDLAVVRLDEVAGVRPLAVADSLPTPGSAILFAGRNDRPGETQRAEVRRLGRCPSLPGVPEALFTTLEGRRGDSGCPVVDENLQVLGLVHGGAACNIAAPTAELAPTLNELAPTPGPN